MMEIRIAKRLHGAGGDIDLLLDCAVANGELVTLYGPSGAGKTSILRMLAGLLEPDQGSIITHGNTWFDSQNHIHLSPQCRKVGMVFQEYSLFPNMSVRGNLEYALEKGQPREIIDELLEQTDMTHLQNRKPSFLSGGQKQRIALARALVRKPDVLLLDEPMSALDSTMRGKLQDYILQVHRNLNLITLMVSHDIREVKKMSDRILLFENGRVSGDGFVDEFFPVFTK